CSVNPTVPPSFRRPADEICTFAPFGTLMSASVQISRELR
ncbi:MAG: hypothetical protein AVDCRST_MAG57-900, partial [uncultured Blastococcus sp.]